MSSDPRRLRGGNVCHRIEIPRRRWPAQGRFALGWPAGAPALPTPVGPGPIPFPLELADPRRAPLPLRDAQEAAAVALEAPAERGPKPPPGDGRSPDDAARAREAAYRREIDMLGRRLDKVRGLLDARDEELRRLIESGRIDSGLASIYREVQGIEEGTPMAKAKKDMLGAIFEANRALKDRIRALGERSDGEG